MTSSDWWWVGFGLRCLALVIGEIASWLFVVPTLFNLHRDAADAAAALIALAALIGGGLATLALTREARLMLEDKS